MSPRRIAFHRFTTRVASYFTVSRGLSSAIFVVLIVLSDHAVAAADAYIVRHVQGEFDPLVLGLVEGCLMALACIAAFSISAWYGLLPRPSDWVHRIPKGELVSVGLLLGIEGVLWAISAKHVAQRFLEGSSVLAIPIVIGLRCFHGIEYHFFHYMGAVYASLGLLSVSFAKESALSRITKYDTYQMFQAMVWGLFLAGVGEFFTRNKRIPIIGVLVPWLLIRLGILFASVIALLGAGNIHNGTFPCLLVGAEGCGAGVPFALLGHSLVLLIRMASYIVVAKYVGPELCVVTAVSSNSLRFYMHTEFSGAEVFACAVSVAGCANFTHGQWMHELSKNEQWDDAVRISAAPTMFSSSDESETESSLLI